MHSKHNPIDFSQKNKNSIVRDFFYHNNVDSPPQPSLLPSHNPLYWPIPSELRVHQISTTSPSEPSTLPLILKPQRKFFRECISNITLSKFHKKKKNKMCAFFFPQLFETFIMNTIITLPNHVQFPYSHILNWKYEFCKVISKDVKKVSTALTNKLFGLETFVMT